MTHKIQRLTAFLLVLVLCVGMMPTALAAEVDDTTAAEPKESTTAPPEESSSGEATGETLPTEESAPPEITTVADAPVSEETIPEETEAGPVTMALENEVAALADSELVGKPQDFCNLFLLEEVTISGDGFNSSREHIPLYAMHMTDQPGYETNYYVAYCIEPGIIVNYGEEYGGNSYIYDDLTDVEGILARLDAAKVRAMGVALLYGQKEIARRADEESVRLEKLRRHAATQVIIWEIACGWREATPPYGRNNSTLYDAINHELEIASTVWGNKFKISGITDAYNDIVAKMAKHYVIPSFASDELSFAQTYTMTTNSSGQHTITLTDTNNILSAYTFTNTDNITYSVSGNKLTITVTGNVSLPLTISPTKNIPDISKQVFYVWENGDDQRMISSFSEPTNDPIPCYFKLQASTSTLSLTKTTEDGKNLSGWRFSIYADQNCTTLISGPHETDANGKLTVSNLSAGTVWVKEIGHKDATVNAQYKCESPNPQQVTLTAGQTASVSFYNKLNTGKCQIVKTATNGGSVAGWHFEVKNSSGTVIGNYVTDSTGIITLDLEPGTYTVTETDGEYKYWENDPNPTKTVTVKAGETAKVTFTNKWRGQAQIVKTATNGGSVAGWHFEVKDSSGTVIGNYVTDATGIITLDLEPGTYTVTETDGEYKYWENDPNPTKTVTVKAGETAKVTFTNKWRGQAQIVKTATNGGSVAGWHFEVKDSSGTVIGNYVTDATGTITLDLEPGTYTVTETDGEYEYWHNDPNPTKTVAVKAGETTKVTFQNQWVGKAKIVKTTTNGGTVEGWEFTITDADGKAVGTYTTDATGTIVVDLNPGTYTVQETDRDDPYWYCDTEPQTVTVKAGETASVTFHNQWIGKAKIIKTLENPEAGTVEGWIFTIHKVTEGDGAMKADYLTTVTTGADGIILQDLEPGDYLISEQLEEGSLWQCVTVQSQMVTVKAGQTAEVTFTNALRPGEIRIQKVDTKGEPLEGVEFLLEWSKDGITWQPVTYTDSAVPQIGGCTTEGLTDGKLASDAEGLATFSGLYPTLQYRLTETATKDGYQLLTDYAYEGSLPVENDLTVTLKIVNAETFTMPKTGSKSLVLMPLSILLCLGVCVGAIVYLRKKEN